MRHRLTRRLPLRLCGGLLLTVVLVAGGSTVGAQEPPADQVTVVMTELAPFVMNDDGEPDGFYAEIWHEVAQDLGVDYDVIWVDSFSELLPLLATGAADVAVAPLAPTAEREALYDFSSAVVASGPQLGVSDRLNSRPSLWRSIFDPRVLGLVSIAVAGLLFVAHLIWLFERNRHEADGDFHKSYLRGIWDGLWWSTVTATTVGYGDKAPKSFGGRLLALVLMMSSLILVGAFASQVTSIMAEDLNQPGIRSLEDVDEPVGVVEGSSFASYVESQGATVRTYTSQSLVFDAAKKGEVNIVVSNPYALATLDSRFGITAIDGVLYEEFETFGLAQGSPWREPINQKLADLQASGEIAEIIKDSLN